MLISGVLRSISEEAILRRMDRRGFFLTFVFVSVLCEIVSAKGDLNDFNTDKQTISPARIAKFYSENVIQGKNIIKLPRIKGIDLRKYYNVGESHFFNCDFNIKNRYSLSMVGQRPMGGIFWIKIEFEKKGNTIIVLWPILLVLGSNPKYK